MRAHSKRQPLHMYASCFLTVEPHSYMVQGSPHLNYTDTCLHSASLILPKISLKVEPHAYMVQASLRPCCGQCWMTRLGGGKETMNQCHDLASCKPSCKPSCKMAQYCFKPALQPTHHCPEGQVDLDELGQRNQTMLEQCFAQRS
eukprot:1161591-Pelagomonas_calceolata.AAC.6